ncbi:MAG: V-type ATP synthase subunit F [bacterium]|nr:V-type ATP synthase subunit F [bacterium]
MGYFVIGDEETVVGFRLAGIRGRAARTPDEARGALGVAAATDGVRVIVITEAVAAWLGEEIGGFDPLRFPLILTVPDRRGPAEGRPSIRDVVRAAVGVPL